MTTKAYGFFVPGGKYERRRPADWRVVFRACCGCDGRLPLDREAYLSHFVFGADFDEYLTRNDSEAGFTGPCGADWLFLDVDREDDIPAAHDDARRLACSILDRYPDLDDGDMLIFLSGWKGFHIGIPTALWQPALSEGFHEAAKRFALAHAERAGVQIDESVYSLTRLFRAPNSQHPKTGLHKRRLALEELMYLSVDGILELARKPDPFTVPVITARSPAAAADWAEAAGAAVRKAAERQAACRDRPPRLVRATLDFIKHGAETGERHARLFRAAANLAELDVPAAAIHELLTEAGLDLGLAPSDVERQVDCGIAHVHAQAQSRAQRTTEGTTA